MCLKEAFGEPKTESLVKKQEPLKVPEVKRIVIRGMNFIPDKIRVRVGTVIEWVVEESRSTEDSKHVIGFDDDQFDIESPPLKKPGDKFKCKF